MTLVPPAKLPYPVVDFSHGCLWPCGRTCILWLQKVIISIGYRHRVVFGYFRLHHPIDDYWWNHWCRCHVEDVGGVQWYFMGIVPSFLLGWRPSLLPL